MYWHLALHWYILLCLALLCIEVAYISGGGVNRQEREVTLTLKHGVEAKNYDDVSTDPSYLTGTINLWPGLKFSV